MSMSVRFSISDTQFFWGVQNSVFSGPIPILLSLSSSSRYSPPLSEYSSFTLQLYWCSKSARKVRNTSCTSDLRLIVETILCPEYSSVKTLNTGWHWDCWLESAQKHQRNHIPSLAGFQKPRLKTYESSSHGHNPRSSVLSVVVNLLPCKRKILNHHPSNTLLIRMTIAAIPDIDGCLGFIGYKSIGVFILSDVIKSVVKTSNTMCNTIPWYFTLGTV